MVGTLRVSFWQKMLLAMLVALAHLLVLGMLRKEATERHHDRLGGGTPHAVASGTSSISPHEEEILVTSDPLINYSLHRGFNFTNALCHAHYRCQDRELHPDMANAQGVLDFTTHIDTSLRILVMGDSVAIQFSQSLQEAALPLADVKSLRRVLRYSWGRHEGLNIAAPTRGGGVVAGWRITGLLKREMENMTLPDSKGGARGGWVRSDADELLGYEYKVNEIDNKTATVNSFDAMIFRIPHGWIKLEEITEQGLFETVHLAQELFGVLTVIFVSLPFINNVLTAEELCTKREKNKMIHQFAQNWKRGDGGVDWVLTIDFGSFADEMIEWNARTIGMNTSEPEEKWILQALYGRGNHRRHIAQVCGELVPDDSKGCGPNKVSPDGIHWCMESMGARLNAGVACLLGCVYNVPQAHRNDMSIRSCEQRCNDRFMSLTPVEDSFIEEVASA